MRRARRAPDQGELFPAAAPPAPVSAPDSPPARAAQPRGPFADSPDRELAVTSFERPILLEAGAGTGKTGTLTARVVTWCLGPGWEEALARSSGARDDDLAGAVLGGVVAITFTEAAAAEMSARVARVLAEVERATAGAAQGEAHDPGALPRELVPRVLPREAALLHARARALRAALDCLGASTIHAFCRRLLAAHPVEAGLDPDFTVDAAGTRAALLVREVLERELREGFPGVDEGALLALARRGLGPEGLERNLLDLLDAGARAADFAGPALDEATCERLLETLARPLARLTDWMPRLARVGHNTPYALAALAGTTGLLAEHARAAPRERLEALCTCFAALWDKRAWERLKKWSKGVPERLTKAEAKALDADRAAFLEAAAELHGALLPLHELDPQGLEAAQRVAQALLAGVEARLRASGTATFGDLLFGARALLRSRPEIARAERARMRQLLVDEFQDTDALQCDIVRALGLEGAPAERPCLFVVGDPKQSIFAWRNADLAAFDEFAEDLVRSGGVRLSLSRNFRSRPAILDEVERVLLPVMERVRGVQPAFAALEPDREAAPESTSAAAPAIEYWVSWTRDEQGELQARTRGQRLKSYEGEARALASDLLRQHGHDELRWQDVAVLFRALTEVEPYLRELRERGIPYEVQSDRKYYQHREVIDAGALVRAVLDPNDHLALVALLRSPLVGLPDAALFPLWERGFPGRMSSLRAAGHAAEDELVELVRSVARALAAAAGDVPGLADIAGWEDSTAHAVRSIARLRASFRVLSTDAWVGELRLLFQPEVIEAARFLGAWRLANLQRFFRDLERALEERGGDVQSVLRTLRADLARDDRSEAARPADSGRDAVKILTIHGAKGLEFRHVYFPQLHKGEPRHAAFGFDRRGQRLSYRIFGLSNPAWFETQAQREETEAAERVRLLYVALTRARDRLVVSGAFPFERGARPWRQAQSFLDLLEHHPALEPALATLAARARADERTPFLDQAGAHWVPTLWIEGETRRRTEEGAMPRTPLAEIEEDSRRLARARTEARRHAARPFQSRPSEEARHERFEERAASAFDPDGSPAETSARPPGVPAPAELDRAAARAAGTAVHRALERIELEGERGCELARARDDLPELVRAALEDGDAGPALERARELWERFSRGPLAARLFELRDHVLARELALLAPPLAEDDAPVGFVSGAIDLLYRDPAGGELVVVDFKTDRVADGGELAQRAAEYQAQGAPYVRAVRAALALEHEPRFELWFLHAGAVV